jgi:hypothetical protein
VKILHSGTGHNTIFNLAVREGETTSVMIVDWQFDPGSALDTSAYAVVETFTSKDYSQKGREPKTWIILANALLKQNRVPEAIQALEKAARNVARTPAASAGNAVSAIEGYPKGRLLSQA